MHRCTETRLLPLLELSFFASNYPGAAATGVGRLPMFPCAVYAPETRNSIRIMMLRRGNVSLPTFVSDPQCL